MKFRTAVRRSTVIIVILIAAVCIGYAYSVFGDRMDIKNHPREFAEYVEKYAAEYGIPEYVVYGVMAVESDFQSNVVTDDGRIGLMQLDAGTYAWIGALLGQTAESGILYDPETNIRCGTYLLAFLYTEYGNWRTALTAYEAGRAEVDLWLADSANYDGDEFVPPDGELANKVERMEEKIEKYRTLYYGTAQN